ncbi:hypothetical protein J1N35_011113 [Gossypium stocksii]|uniref:Uncharacterized protein n=1 Tax=Gossypium stocksii TaxID=47602 RepID=A0A9D3W3E4_9ROSI|nr:hypothetical protein J1N35_011113 [Gossypium stocksii]
MTRIGIIYGKYHVAEKDAYKATIIIEELEKDEDDYGGTENNANGTSVGEADMTRTENVGLLIDLEDNGQSSDRIAPH